MKLLLDCGSGGRASQRLVADIFLRRFDNPVLRRLDDGAVLDMAGPLVMSTDGYTVSPLFFPGGDIGSLAVHGTVNDVSMMGGRPRFLSCAFILEEGLDMAILERIAESMAVAAQAAGVSIVTGDTKVVPKGACDKVFITTTGIGEVIANPSPSGRNARAGDVILVSGSMGDHGLTTMSQREGLSFMSNLASDSAPLNHMAERLILKTGEIHVLRDPTRGGLATALNEIAEQSGVSCLVDESDVPVSENVRAGCHILGLDPLYLANECKLICIVPEERAEAALSVMRADPAGESAAVVGRVVAAVPGSRVILKTLLGGRRLLPMLEGAPFPRIC